MVFQRLRICLALTIMAFAAGCADRPDRISADTPPEESIVILVGLDGFRWDAAARADTPNFDRLAAAGVSSAGMIPVFPSLSFPNLYTLVTGLYPQNHGIVANEMYDPYTDSYFSSKVFDDGRWWGGEPIWVTLEKQGVRTATVGWIASEAEIGGKRPTYVTPYFPDLVAMMPDQRADTVLELLDLPDGERPRFLTLYHDEVDNFAHAFGVGSLAEKAAIERMDAMIGRLLDGLESRDLMSRTTVIVVADHGMANIVDGQVIYLDDFIDIASLRREALGLGPIANIWPIEDDAEDVFQRLAGAHPHLKVYRRADIPARYRLGDNPRMPPILVVADEGWMMTAHGMEPAPQVPGGPSFPRGMHGYDNQSRDMHAIFIASGSAVRRGVEIGPFRNVNVYGLIAHIIGVEPAPNDGDPAEWRVMLRNDPDNRMP